MKRSWPVGCRLSLASTASLAAVALALVGCDADAGGDFGTIGPGGGYPYPGADTATVVEPDEGPNNPWPDVPAASVPEADAGPEAEADAAVLGATAPEVTWPPGVGERGAATASASHVAWVERPAGGGMPALVVWALDGETAPHSHAVPNLLHPSQLALGDGWLFYVDDRYGDEDVFALSLTTGAEAPIATGPGAQRVPAARGDTVVWEDCRDCGGDPDLSEIYRRVMSADAEQRLTFDDVPDRAPALGTLADGSDGLAFVSDETEVVVVDAGGAAVSWAVGARVSALALDRGRIAWRASPAIINPDSMRPTDVYITDALTGETVQASTHAELAPGLAGAPSASFGRVAWLESVPADPTWEAQRVQVVDAVDLAPVFEIVETLVHGVRLQGDLLVFLAPRADNGDLDDVWIIDLDP